MHSRRSAERKIKVSKEAGVMFFFSGYKKCIQDHPRWATAELLEQGESYNDM